LFLLLLCCVCAMFCGMFCVVFVMNTHSGSVEKCEFECVFYEQKHNYIELFICENKCVVMY
jgi:hypothetical protein